MLSLAVPPGSAFFRASYRRRPQSASRHAGSLRYHFGAWHYRGMSAPAQLFSQCNENRRRLKDAAEFVQTLKSVPRRSHSV
jgi:hypothetical protein